MSNEDKLEKIEQKAKEYAEQHVGGLSQEHYMIRLYSEQVIMEHFLAGYNQALQDQAAVVKKTLTK